MSLQTVYIADAVFYEAATFHMEFNWKKFKEIFQLVLHIG
jgi:hypothetical protein